MPARRGAAPPPERLSCNESSSEDTRGRLAQAQRRHPRRWYPSYRQARLIRLAAAAPGRHIARMASDRKPDLDTLRLLINSALEIVTDLGHESTHRAIRALAAIPPDERSVIATALERAAVTW